MFLRSNKGDVGGLAADETPMESESLRSNREKLVGAAAQESSQNTLHGTAAHAETAEAKPVRGVVLEFATRMRQSRGREVALND